MTSIVYTSVSKFATVYETLEFMDVTYLAQERANSLLYKTKLLSYKFNLSKPLPNQFAFYEELQALCGEGEGAMSERERVEYFILALPDMMQDHLTEYLSLHDLVLANVTYLQLKTKVLARRINLTGENNNTRKNNNGGDGIVLQTGGRGRGDNRGRGRGRGGSRGRGAGDGGEGGRGRGRGQDGRGKKKEDRIFTCFNCGEEGHKTWDCPRPVTKEARDKLAEFMKEKKERGYNNKGGLNEDKKNNDDEEDGITLMMSHFLHREKQDTSPTRNTDWSEPSEDVTKHTGSRGVTHSPSQMLRPSIVPYDPVLTLVKDNPPTTTVTRRSFRSADFMQGALPTRNQAFHLNDPSRKLLAKVEEAYEYDDFSIDLDNDLILDSGSTAHTCINKSLLTDFTPCSGKFYSSKKHAYLQVLGKGTMKVTVDIDGKAVPLTFTNVNYVPDCSANLLSISLLESKGLYINSKDGFKMIQRSTGRTVIQAKTVHNLYVLNRYKSAVDYSLMTANNVAKSSRSELYNWHDRLGHIGVDRLKELHKQGTISFDLRDIATFDCEVCTLGKAHRAPIFNNPIVRAKNVGERLYADISEMPCAGLEGEKYLYIAVDCKSRVYFGECLKTKDKATVVSENCISFVNNQLDKNAVKVFHTDPGEMRNDRLTAYCAARGIKRTYTAPDTPEQNAPAERAFRTIVDAARCMIFNSNLSARFWPYACMYAIYIRNRAPSKSIATTPLEEFKEEKQSLHKCRVFGCRVLVLNPTYTNKLDIKTFEAVFIGMAPGEHGYKLYNPATSKIFHSRNVKFYEQQFPEVKWDEDDDLSDEDWAPPSRAKDPEPTEQDWGFDTGPDLSSDSEEEDLKPFQAPRISLTNTVNEGEVNLSPLMPDRDLSSDNEDMPPSPQARPDPSPDLTPEPPLQTQRRDFPIPEEEEAPRVTPLITPMEASKVEQSEQHSPRISLTDTVNDEGVVESTPPSCSNISKPPSMALKPAPRDIYNEAMFKPPDPEQRGRKKKVTTREKPQPEPPPDKPSLSLTHTRSTRSTRSSTKSKLFPLLFATHSFHTALYTHTASNEYFADPLSYSEVLDRPDRDKWMVAMNNEIRSLKNMNTFRLTTLPKGRFAIKCKWVFKLKRNTDGSINKYKARLVAKGFTQRKEIDYTETYAPVARTVSTRVLVAIAAREELHLETIDIDNAYLNGIIDAQIFMTQPEGYVNPKFTDTRVYVLEVLKGLYGLKQAGRLWHDLFGNYLFEIGFTNTRADPCFYIRYKNGRRIALVMHVDDLLTAGRKADIYEFIGELRQRFKLQHETARQFLGIKITRTTKGIKLSQEFYIQESAKQLGLENQKPNKSPLTEGQVKSFLSPDTKAQPLPPKDITMYKRIVGKMLYAAICTRPDMAFATSLLGRYAHAPNSNHLSAAKHAMAYLLSNASAGLLFPAGVVKGNDNLLAFSDSDFAQTEGRKSISGVAVFFYQMLIHWLSHRQSCVSLSSSEAELRAMLDTTKICIWLRMLLKELGYEQTTATIIYEDNQPAISLTKETASFQRTKHIDVIHCFMQEKINKDKIVRIIYVPTNDNAADIFTKQQDMPRFKLGIKQLAMEHRLIA